MVSCGHCVVCLSIYGFWLPLWYLVAIVLSVFLFTASGCTFGIFCPLCCLSFIELRLLVAPLVSFAQCVVYPSLIYGFWLHLWYLLPIVLSILHWFTASACTFGIFCPLCCLSFIRSFKSMKDIQHNGQKIPKVQSEAVSQWRTYNTMGKRKRTNEQYNDLQNTTQETKDRATPPN
jgi:hypothetical protein